jgi:uncharacterized protein
MQLAINETLSTILQVALFSLIAYVFFRFRKDKSVMFQDYLGLIAPPAKSVALGSFASLLFVGSTLFMIFVDDDLKNIMLNPPSITGKIREMGMSGASIYILLIIAVFKTSFAEELLFRGLIAKRLIARFGFKTGNLAQAAIFGLIHVLLFLFAKPSLSIIAFLFLMTGIGAYLIGYVNEKLANGSIAPGWIAHGMGNLLSYSIIGFVV